MSSVLLRSEALFMVHAPTEIWAMIDQRDFLSATRVFLRAKAVADKAKPIQPSSLVREETEIVLGLGKEEREEEGCMEPLCVRAGRG